jgi:hypothetical protein
VPSATAPRIATVDEPPSVSSTCTTVSAPAGIAAPVMIAMHVPGSIECASVEPAGISPCTGRLTGVSAVAPAMSSARTA